MTFYRNRSSGLDVSPLFLRIERYERQRARGFAAPHTHARLCEDIRTHAGEPYARFFVRQHALPLVTEPWWLPYPMRWRRADAFYVLVMMIVPMVTCMALFWTGAVRSTYSAFGAIGAILLLFGGIAVAVAVTVLVPRLVPPRDLEHRLRLVAAFQEDLDFDEGLLAAAFWERNTHQPHAEDNHATIQREVDDLARRVADLQHAVDAWKLTHPDG